MAEVLVGILFCFFFIPFRLYLLWVNYKGRFRYKLWEHSPFWRTLDRKVGVFSLVLDFFLSIAIVVVLSALTASMFGVPMGIGTAFVLFGAIGWTFVNMAFDKISVEKFEKKCLQCKHKKECMDFHNEKCISEPIRQLSKSAVLYEERKREGRS